MLDNSKYSTLKHSTSKSILIYSMLCSDVRVAVLLIRLLIIIFNSTHLLYISHFTLVYTRGFSQEFCFIIKLKEVKERHVNKVTRQSLKMRPWVSMPPNTKHRCFVSLSRLSALSSTPVSALSGQGTTHVEWSSRFCGRSPSNFNRVQRCLSEDKRNVILIIAMSRLFESLIQTVISV